MAPLAYARRCVEQVALHSHRMLNLAHFWRAVYFTFVRSLSPEPLVSRSSCDWTFDAEQERRFHRVPRALSVTWAAAVSRRWAPR